IFTPGSASGRPLSVLRTLEIDAALADDPDAFRERVQSTVQGILTLLDIDADPLTSREHILLSKILSETWKRGERLTLASLIASVQSPPFERVGVMELDSFYPAGERFELAMRLNNLLAAPSFQAWTEGEPLDIRDLLHTQAGKPRVSVLSIAHLSDAERMFFVTTLLTEIVAWMRAQSGSPSLRAILYMDEVFGYLPPVANPPCKPLFLTLLKQARAFGLGLVLATQNPVDLDYKALSNIGTWMIGRLQTKRDIDRVRSGLESASGSGNIDLEKLDTVLAGMPKRCFLLNNVHDARPTIFHTRWVLSYLAGPLTAEQIRQLTAVDETKRLAQAASEVRTAKRSKDVAQSERPLLDPAIVQWFIPATKFPAEAQKLIYVPGLLVGARLRYSRANPPIDSDRRVLLIIPANATGRAPDWDAAVILDELPHALLEAPESDASFAPLPEAYGSPATFSGNTSRIRRWLRASYPLTVFRSDTHKCYSTPGESEGEFRARLQELGNRERDRRAGVLRARYEKKLARLQARLQRAEQRVAKESEQARTQKLDTAISFGTAVLGALLGRKAISTTSAGHLGSAIRKAGRAREQTADVSRARETLAAVQADVDELATAFEKEIEQLEDAYDATAEELSSREIAAKLTDIEVDTVGVGWEPHFREANGSVRSVAARSPRGG
ncbi:MAG: ATP-binding protein, partial [Gammaproteobacteria bacterium]